MPEELHNQVESKSNYVQEFQTSRCRKGDTTFISFLTQAIPTSRTVKIVKKLEHLTLWVAFAQAPWSPMMTCYALLIVVCHWPGLVYHLHTLLPEKVFEVQIHCVIGNSKLNPQTNRCWWHAKRPLVSFHTKWLGETLSRVIQLCLWWEPCATQKLEYRRHLRFSSYCLLISELQAEVQGLQNLLERWKCNRVSCTGIYRDVANSGLDREF